MNTPLLELSDVSVEFPAGRRQTIRVVDRVGFEVQTRETVGLVGESGAGKTTVCRTVLGLAPIHGGTVRFESQDITYADHRVRRSLSAKLQAVFQDPYSSLNPTQTVAEALIEPVLVHEKPPREELSARVADMLDRVGLPRDAGGRYPVHFSGGQRQRIAIARALMVSPRLVICDEPVSALDLSVQAQVLNLLRSLQRDFELSYVFVAHDLSVVRHISHRVIVMYHGRIMESGPCEAVYRRPRHPYTRALLDAVPVPEPARQRLRRLARKTIPTEDAPSVLGDSCPFVSRCPFAIDVCREEQPELIPADEGVSVACHRWRELEADGALRPQ